MEFAGEVVFYMFAFQHLERNKFGEHLPNETTAAGTILVYPSSRLNTIEHAIVIASQDGTKSLLAASLKNRFAPRVQGSN